MEKIKMTTPLVEMDGDEMTRILWKMIKDELIYPFVELKTEYYDLGLIERERTKDQVTIDSANATKKYGVAVKCATITPNKQRVEEYNLSEMWKSPNGTIRAILDGTVFRAPIIIDPIKPQVKNWKKPITIARHAYGDVYKGTEFRVTEPGKAELVFTGESGEGQRATIYDFKLMFQEIYDTCYKEEFEKLGIKYFYTLIDDAVARVIRSEGGYIWACKNYDGDVMSDMVSTAFGSLAMMTSVLVSPDGNYEYEAAHGTVTRHYYKYLKGEETSTNPMATIFAWSGALRKRGEMDNLPDLVKFADNLEAASIETLMEGTMTKDLVGLVDEGFETHAVNSLEFIQAIRKHVEAKY